MRYEHRRTAFLALATGLLLLCADRSASAAEVTTVKMPAIAQRPQVAVDAKGVVHLVFGHKDQRGDLLYARYDEKTNKFSDPIKVNSTPQCAAAFNMTVGKNGRVHVLIRPNAKYSHDKLNRRPVFADLKYMLYCRLNDTGTAFEPERDLSADTFAFEGVGAVLANDKGTVLVYWHGLSKPGPEPTRKLFLAKSEDEGKTFTEPKVVRNKVTGACACCSMGGALGPDGRVHLAFRNSLPNRNKDSYLLTSEDGDTTFSAKMLGAWPEAGCPGSVYSLTTTKDGAFVAWDTEGHVHFAPASHVDHKVTAPSGPKRSRAPVLAANAKGEVLFAWSEAKDAKQFRDGADLAWRVYDKNGKPLTKKQTLPAAVVRWSFPAAYAKPNGDFVIFYDGDS